MLGTHPPACSTASTCMHQAPSRSQPLPDLSPSAGAKLEDVLKPLGLEEQRAALQFELSYGQLGDSGWHIMHSTLPGRAGQISALRPVFAAPSHHLRSQHQHGNCLLSIMPGVSHWRQALVASIIWHLHRILPPELPLWCRPAAAGARGDGSLAQAAGCQ